MKIIADKEGIQAIQQLCDIALKQGGLQNLQGIQVILGSIEEAKEQLEVVK